MLINILSVIGLVVASVAMLIGVDALIAQLENGRWSEPYYPLRAERWYVVLNYINTAMWAALVVSVFLFDGLCLYHVAACAILSMIEKQWNSRRLCYARNIIVGKLVTLSVWAMLVRFWLKRKD